VDRRTTLSLNEWAVLGVLVQRPRHGYDIAAELRRGATIGRAWRVDRQFVYRALERLEGLGLAEPRRTEPGEGGPPRTVFGSTRKGRAALKSWLHEPVEHLRDVRGGLLLKLVLLQELDLDRGPLVEAQRVAIEAHLVEHRSPPAGDDVVAQWRHHSAAAVDAFLASLDQG
jgi:DNA-binding PadR family transcriptional regulator